jgi:hypothetical protein
VFRVIGIFNTLGINDAKARFDVAPLFASSQPDFFNACSNRLFPSSGFSLYNEK